MAVEVSKASIIKKKLITKYHQLHFCIDSGEDKKNVSKFHRQDNLTEDFPREEKITSEVLLQSDSKAKDEVIEDLLAEKINAETMPIGSIVKRIIVRKGLIVEKVFQPPKGSNISVFF